MRELKDWTRADIEDWLYTEAALLDEWRLPEWRQLFTEDASYLVPNMAGDPYASPAATLYLIADDGHHLTERVKRLGKKTAHAEYPHSITHRTISNVRLLGIENGDLKVSCNFTTNRANSQSGVIDTYFGRQEYKFVQSTEGLLAREKRSILSIGALRPHGRLSIIL